ncbi:MAG TPA: 50S ribosomal protein L11 methyltransferase [Firmicutes bacterium]|nr:50S ribosomal protein L11 methyltransferase [Bacillota bacterium]
MAKEWAEISIQTGQEGVEAIANVLHEAGAGGVVIEDPGLVPAYRASGRWDAAEVPDPVALDGGVRVKAYLPVNAELRERLAAVQAEVNRVLGILNLEGKISLQRVAEEEWATAWKSYYKPVRIGRRLVIKPAWEDFPAGTDDIVIELDPGMAFGTGTHPTTAMALTLLEKYLKPGASVFDIGTGSGILAIAAARLGAGEVTAVDADPVAVEAAWENCQRNGVTDQVSVQAGSLFEELPGTADLILANITPSVLLELVPELGRHLNPGGCFIGSGVIEPSFDEVKEALLAQGLKLVEILGQEEWVAFAARREEG